MHSFWLTFRFKCSNSQHDRGMGNGKWAAAEWREPEQLINDDGVNDEHLVQLNRKQAERDRVEEECQRKQ